MKKTLTVFLMIIMLIIPVKAYGINENVIIDVKVNGNAEVGENLDISLNITNVENLYGAQLEYKYNPDEIELISIEGGNFIKEGIDNIFEPFSGQNEGKYGFTYMGDFKGKAGSGVLCNIKIKLLKNIELTLDKNNLNLMLVERDKNDNMNEMKFVFKGIENKDTEEDGANEEDKEKNDEEIIEQNTVDKEDIANEEDIDKGNTEEGSNETNEINEENTEESNKSEEGTIEKEENSESNTIINFIILSSFLVILGGGILYYKKNK